MKITIRESLHVLPQSKLFRIEIKVKMCSGHLHTLGIIPEFILIAVIESRLLLIILYVLLSFWKVREIEYLL